MNLPSSSDSDHAPLSGMAPYDQARLNEMFGHDRQLHREILALFVTETFRQLDTMIDALLLGRMTEARMLAQEIYTDSANLGLGQISMLAHLAVNAGFANDLDGQLRLHARLMNALDALSTALEDFPAGGVA